METANPESVTIHTHIVVRKPHDGKPRASLLVEVNSVEEGLRYFERLAEQIPGIAAKLAEQNIV